MDRADRLPSAAPTRGRGAGALLGAFALGALWSAVPLGAQEAPPTQAPDSVPAARAGASPRGAFLRAAALPGWGHASIGAYHRGAFYFVVEGASAWMLLKTRRRYAQAEARLAFESDVLRTDLLASGVTDEAKIQERLDADPALEDLRNLKEARRQQREDWTAVSIFLVLLSGVDAFVSAHLQEFPAPLTVGAQPVGNGRVELSVGITLPR